LGGAPTNLDLPLHFYSIAIAKDKLFA